MLNCSTERKSEGVVISMDVQLIATFQDAGKALDCRSQTGSWPTVATQ